jgi:hypothetical protein
MNERNISPVLKKVRGNAVKHPETLSGDLNRASTKKMRYIKLVP